MNSLLLAAMLSLTPELTLLESELVLEAPGHEVSLMPSAGGGVLPGVLSFVLPGLGQVANGRPLRGAAFFLGTAVGAMGIGVAQVGPDAEPSAANYVGIGMVVLSAVLYVWNIYDAATDGGAPL